MIPKGLDNGKLYVYNVNGYVFCTYLESNTSETGCLQTKVLFALGIPCYYFE